MVWAKPAPLRSVYTVLEEDLDSHPGGAAELNLFNVSIGETQRSVAIDLVFYPLSSTSLTKPNQVLKKKITLDFLIFLTQKISHGSFPVFQIVNTLLVKRLTNYSKSRLLSSRDAKRSFIFELFLTLLFSEKKTDKEIFDELRVRFFQ